MKKHYTKEKGDLGVFKAQLDLFEKGYMILQPQTEHAPFDLVAYKDGVFKRIQVKYREVNSKGSIEIRFRSSYSTSNGVQTKKIDKNEVDYYCIYCPQTDLCYYIQPSKYQESISIRVLKSKNNQTSNTHDSSHFLEI